MLLVGKVIGTVQKADWEWAGPRYPTTSLSAARFGLARPLGKARQALEERHKLSAGATPLNSNLTGLAGWGPHGA